MSVYWSGYAYLLVGLATVSVLLAIRADRQFSFLSGHQRTRNLLIFLVIAWPVFWFFCIRNALRGRS